VALSGLSETSARLSAFGAKRTSPECRDRADLTKMTQLRHWATKIDAIPMPA